MSYVCTLEWRRVNNSDPGWPLVVETVTDTRGPGSIPNYIGISITHIYLNIHNDTSKERLDYSLSDDINRILEWKTSNFEPFFYL